MQRTALLLMGMALLAGCGNDSSTESQELATLRTLTEPYKSFDAGKAAGYTQFAPPQAAAMAHH